MELIVFVCIVMAFGSLGLIALFIRMRFFPRRTRLLAVCPRVSKTDDTIVARTTVKGWLASLTMVSRVVVVDRNRKRVKIRRRLFWFFQRRRTIPFGHIERILYAYEDWSLTRSFDITGDTVDCFSVKLRLYGDEDVHLFHFFGEGDFQRGFSSPIALWLPDWFFWRDRLWDTSGSQEADSKRFVDLLQEYIGVPVAPG